MNFIDIAKSRYATKKFSGDSISQEQWTQLQELITLSASSFGLQPYRIKVITDMQLKEKLAPAAWNQPQITTCSHLLVFCADTNVSERIDAYEKMMLDSGSSAESAKAYTDTMRGMVDKLTQEQLNAWAARQTYIAIGNAINGAKAVGVDSCPMEGFDAQQFKSILELPESLVPCALVSVGIAADEPRPKLRFDDLFV